MTESFQEVSYKRHEKHNSLTKGTLSEIQESWFREDTIDYWRHARMYNPLTPLLKSSPKSKWITVGDGRFGLDSIKLKKIESSLDILPTDISTELLEKAKTIGTIKNFAKENAEKLSFADNYFDFAFCKESFHHFPRPYIALYEMLRVAKKGVVLIEPNEFFPFPWFGQLVLSTKKAIKKLLRIKIPHPDDFSFEESGNYIYTVSRRELAKVALGLNFPAIAVYKFNDYYAAGVEFEKAEPTSALFKEIKRQIAKRDTKSRLGYEPCSNIIGIIFKENPNDVLVKELKDAGFEIDFLPENPYCPRRD